MIVVAAVALWRSFCACEELLPNRVDWWHLSSLAGAFLLQRTSIIRVYVL